MHSAEMIIIFFRNIFFRWQHSYQVLPPLDVQTLCALGCV